MSATPRILKRNNGSIHKNSIVKLDSNTRLIINKIPATIQPTMKRTQTSVAESISKSTKYAVQTIASTGTPISSLQWEAIGNSATVRSQNTIATAKKQLGAVISSLPPNTIIQAKSTGQVLNGLASTALGTNEAHTTVTPAAPHSGIDIKPVVGTMQVRRPTVFVKHDSPKRTPRDIIIELIEKSPHLHLGLQANRLPLLKSIICATADVRLTDCYMTLKKMRLNEDFGVLGEYFEVSETQAQLIFARTITKLSRFLRFLVRWPDTNKRYERLKNLPFAYRSKMSHVQSMIECVETDLQEPAKMDCLSYKYILGITPNGVICYVSEAFVGYHDDLVLFDASSFHSTKPPYMQLVTDPGKAIRRKRVPKSKTPTNDSDSTTESADESLEDDDADTGRSIGRYGAARITGEIASYHSLSIVNNELTSSKARGLTVPVTHMPETAMCREQLHDAVDNLRAFKILQHHGIKEPLVYQYINEILICAAALVNLQQ